MDLMELIKTRRTIRKYKDEKIPRKVIDEIIDAGRWAPSAHNLQPWKIVVLTSKEKIVKISDLLEQKAGGLLSGFNIVMRDTAKNLKNAPVVLLVYSNGVISKKFDRFGAPYADAGNIYETQSVATAIENMLLYSHSLGLGMAWYGMTLFCEDEINAFLKQSDKLSAVLSLGYPDESPEASKRKDLSEISEYVV